MSTRYKRVHDKLSCTRLQNYTIGVSPLCIRIRGFVNRNPRIQRVQASIRRLYAYCHVEIDASFNCVDEAHTQGGTRIHLLRLYEDYRDYMLRFGGC